VNPVRVVVVLVALLLPTVLVTRWVGSAEERLAPPGQKDAEEAAIASSADEGYCSAGLKRVLRRVLTSCGLIGGEGDDEARGCQPVQAKNVATMAGADFNALFRPMRERGGIIEFEQGKAELDPADQELVDKIFVDQRGASYLFVVSRASPEGSVESNRELSRARAEGVMAHLRQKFDDPDLDKEVGLLWLGEEFAQLEDEFCQWRRSSAPGSTCAAAEINRSAFIAWIDCTL
jgi:outer membrane protein OmpA-like peptidoglycan-associated protein